MLDRRVLTAPFTNKTNLITILIVTSLFAVFRLAGGGLFGSASPSGVGEEQEAQPARTVPADKRNPSSNRDLLTGILGDNKAKDSTGKAVNKPKDKKTGGGLDDIERALGMR